MASRAMVQTAALVVDTFREAFARKIIWGFIACSTLLILFFLVLVKIDVVQGGIAISSMFNNRPGLVNPAEETVRNVHAGIAGTLYVYGLILAILASAGLIPTIFEPGRIELLLSKPVERVHILLGRYLGNVLLVALNMFYPVVALWILFGVKTGIWTSGFLWSSVLTVFIFSVYLAVILLIGVVWESAAVATMVTFGLMILGLILFLSRTGLEKLLSSEWSRDIVRGMYYVLPKVADIDKIMINIVRDKPIDSWMPVWSTALFGVACLGTGLFLFQRKNY